MLSMLKVEPIQIPVSRAHYKENPYWVKECGQIDEVELEMMKNRWKVFNLQVAQWLICNLMSDVLPF